MSKYLESYIKNPKNFIQDLITTMLDEINTIPKAHSIQYKTYKTKKIIEKYIEKIMINFYKKRIKYNETKIEINIIEQSIFIPILTDGEIKILNYYLSNGLVFNMKVFSNIIYYVERIFRLLYLRIGITNAKHEKNNIFHYSELSNLIKKKIENSDYDNAIDFLFYCIMTSEGYNIRNKIIHGKYNSNKDFFKNGFLLLLVVFTIFNFDEENKDGVAEIVYRK